MNILFIGEDLDKSRSGVVTVMNQILHDESLKGKANFKTVFTTSDDYSTVKKLYCWLKAYIKFLYYLPSCKIVHIHHASDLNFWLSAGMGYLSKFFGKKTLLHNHSADFHEFYEKSSQKNKNRIAKVFQNITATIVLSNHWLTWYSQIAPKAKFFMLQNAIEIPKDIVPKDIEADEVILIYLARIEKRKGFFDLIEVMPQIIVKFPNIKLYVAGQGDITNANEMVKRNGLENNVIILGYINSEERNSFLRRAHVLVFPSYNEGLPMSLLEAMSYGLVPITTPVGGIPDVVKQDENGHLISPGDTLALENSIGFILNSPMLYKKLSENAKLTVLKDFNYQNYGEKLMNIYTYILK